MQFSRHHVPDYFEQTKLVLFRNTVHSQLRTMQKLCDGAVEEIASTFKKKKIYGAAVEAVRPA
jgi:hypothetical protein